MGKRYVDMKVKILEEMLIEPPPRSKIEELYKEKNLYKVDAFFHRIMLAEPEKEQRVFRPTVSCNIEKDNIIEDSNIQASISSTKRIRPKKVFNI